MEKAKSYSPTYGRRYFLVIKSLIIDGFRSFENAYLEFAPGQNYIFGQNWQGKSSIVDAIGFALFGLEIFPKKLAGTAVKADHLVNESCTRAKIRLQFDLAGTSYSIERTLPGRVVTLSCAGAAIASGIKPVGEKLTALLNIDAKLFQNIFYSDQDELRKSLEFSPEDRRIFIERLLGVEEWRAKLDTIRATQRFLESFLVDLTSGRLGAFLEHMQQLEDDIDRRREGVGDLRINIRELQRTAPKSVAAVRHAESSTDCDIAELQHSEVGLETRLEVAQSQQSELRTGRCPTCSQAVPRDVRSTQIARISKDIATLKKELKNLGRQLRIALAVAAEEDYEGSYELFAELKAQKATLESEERQLLADSTRLKKLRVQAKAFGKKPRQVERTKQEIAFLERIESVIQDFRRSLRGRLAKQLVIGTNDLLSRFHDGDNDAAVRIDDDLNIAVDLHGQSVPIFNLSGAAKDILALALRYGLLRVAAGGIRFFILDEPTRHMDPSNCHKLKALFNDLLDCQLIVVTVNSEFSDAAGRHFRVAKDDSFHSIIAESW
jgi:DNA repair protein SbcC/Rad50